MGRPKKDEEQKQKELVATARTAICKLIHSLYSFDQIRPLADEVEEILQQISFIQNGTKHDKY